MRNLLALVGLLVVGFAGFGWYLGWYKLSFSRTNEGNLEIKTNVDTKKVGQDATDAVKNAAASLGEHIVNVQDTKSTAPTTPPGGTPGPMTPPQGSILNPPTLPSVPNTPVVLPPPKAPGPMAPMRDPIPLFPPK